MEISEVDIKPEQRMVLAVIGCAISDLLNKQYREGAMAKQNIGGEIINI